MKAIILFLLFAGVSLAQFATPTYTDYLRLRKYAQGDTPSADSLNANWTGLDNWADGVAELDSANTYSARQTYSSGATFSSGANGAVNFADSVNMVSATKVLINYQDVTVASARIGTTASPYLAMYSRYFIVPNTEGNDSVSISYDDSTITFDKAVSFPSLTITDNITIDSSASFNVLAFEPHSYAIPNVGDTILSLTSTDRYSCIMLDLPGDVTPGISRIYIQGAQKGMILRIYNDDAVGYCLFTDIVGDDDNLYMSADLTMNKYDYIEFMCVVESIIGQTWMETGRSDN